MASQILQALLSFYLISLRSGLLSGYISRDVYAMGCPAHAHYTLNIHSESFASSNQLKNALKTNYLNFSYWGRTYFVHASIVLIVKPITKLYSLCFFILFNFYFTYPYHSWLDRVWRLLYCHNYWFSASHPYENSFSGNS